MNKFTVLVFAIAISVASAGVVKPLTNKERDAIDNVHEKCQRDPETKIDEFVVSKLRAGEKVEDPKLKAHLLCMGKGASFIKENGDLNSEYIKSKWREHYEGEQLTQLNECLVQKDTPEDTAFELARCHYKVVGKHIHH